MKNVVIYLSLLLLPLTIFNSCVDDDSPSPSSNAFSSGSNTLNLGQTVAVEEFILSSDGTFRCILQSDGNLVINDLVNGGNTGAGTNSVDFTTTTVVFETVETEVRLSFYTEDSTLVAYFILDSDAENIAMTNTGALISRNSDNLFLETIYSSGVFPGQGNSLTLERVTI